MSDIGARAFESLVRHFIGDRVDRLALYAATVIGQNADGTLELQADNPRIGSPSSVPIRWGIPGLTATVPAGARCYLTFAEGDPTKPIVVAWEAGTALGIVLAGGSHGVARTTDAVGAATAMATWIAAVGSYINGHGGSISSPTDFGTISGGSSVVKAG
jgi:hypothetical protein